jgi:hypothetical protein
MTELNTRLDQELHAPPLVPLNSVALAEMKAQLKNSVRLPALSGLPPPKKTSRALLPQDGVVEAQAALVEGIPGLGLFGPKAQNPGLDCAADQLAQVPGVQWGWEPPPPDRARLQDLRQVGKKERGQKSVLRRQLNHGATSEKLWAKGTQAKKKGPIQVKTQVIII